MSQFIFCLKQINFSNHFLHIFSTLPSTQTIKDISLIFFNKKLSTHLKPVPILLGLLLDGSLNSDPPPLKWLNEDQN